MNKKGIKFDIIYFDRYDIEEHNTAEKTFRFIASGHNQSNKFTKIKKYIEFRRFIKKVILSNNYKKLIIWNSLTAYLIFDVLIKKYSNKYFLNIRDYAFENIFFINRLMKSLIDNSLITTYSSPGFLEFLPINKIHQDKVLFINSINEDLLEKIKPRGISSKDPINIGFLGNVRFFENDKKLLKLFDNDERFTLSYYGTNSEVLEDFAISEGITNVKFKGAFKNEEINEILSEIDIMNNLYGTNSVALDSAISIKYYHALMAAIPIILYEGTYMEKFCVNKFSVNHNSDNYNLPNEVYEWYKSLDNKSVKLLATLELNKKLDENEKTKKRIYEEL
ncbi:hypothetical protein [Exiguobacterium sp. s152]|uniref:hypothetical protein n=1 Tax=Exiguobacterium sp. s152 TaxID=2751226 RepID=UPI001BE5962C|nr:hypothetical protein [Exiguobacterium sp. s152]